MRIALNGGFDLLHSGHIGFIKQASEWGEVIVILNSDLCLKQKKGFVFMPQEERKTIVENIKGVAQVLITRDCDDNKMAVGEILEKVRPDLMGIVEQAEKGEELIPICERLGIRVVRLKRANTESSTYLAGRYYDHLQNALSD